MPLRSRSVDELVRIVTAGAAVRFDAAGWATDDLIKIARATSGSQIRVVYIGLTGRRADELIQIASAGGGCVMFED